MVGLLRYFIKKNDNKKFKVLKLSVSIVDNLHKEIKNGLRQTSSTYKICY